VDTIFNQLGMKLSGVIALQLDLEVLVKRMTARRTCSRCHAIVNLDLESSTGDKCPNCGGELIQRDDDNETVVRKRLETYRYETEPLVNYYEGKGELYPVNGLGTVEEVGGRIAEVLGVISQKSDPHG
jgi:adenylate kinase